MQLGVVSWIVFVFSNGVDDMSAKEQVQTLSAEVKPLGELLQYQDGSIVSRVLLKNKGGTVTLFAFDQGEG